MPLPISAVDGTHGGRETHGEGATHHPRRRRSPRAVSGILPSERARSAGTNRPLHAEGPRYGIRLSAAVVVGSEGRELLSAAAVSGVSNRRESIANSRGRIAPRAAGQENPHSGRPPLSHQTFMKGSHPRASTDRGRCSRPPRSRAPGRGGRGASGRRGTRSTERRRTARCAAEKVPWPAATITVPREALAWFRTRLRNRATASKPATVAR